MFGRESTPTRCASPTREFAKPGVRVLQRDGPRDRPGGAAGHHGRPATYEADVLVVALGADYDIDATPGLAEAGNEFYSVAGAERLARAGARLRPGPGDRRRLRRALQVPAGAERGGAAAPRPPRPAQGVRDHCEITFVIPLPEPRPAVPRDVRGAARAPSPSATSPSCPASRIASLDAARRVTVLDDGDELPYDLFFGVPKHRAPDVVLESGLAEDGYVPVDSRTLATRFPGVYAIGDVATVGVPKAGVFAEGAGAGPGRVADRRAARAAAPAPATRAGAPATSSSAAAAVGRVDVDFLSGPKPTGTYHAPSRELVAEKQDFGASRAARWFGR